MRILTVVNTLSAGGTQRVAQNYSLGYARAGHEVGVLAYRDGGPREAVLQEAGLPTFVGGPAPAQRTDAVERAAAWGPDLVHIHRPGRADPESGGVLRRLKAGPRRPAVLETNVFSRVDYSPDRRLIDVHLQLSQWCLWRWQQWAAWARPRPVGAICSYAVDADDFYPASPAERAAFRAEHGIPADAFLFGRIGQPIVWKWSPVIFDAFEQVAADEPRAHLLLVGLPDELRPRLRALPPGIRARVVEIGFLHGDPALRACYSALDAFLHASHIGESFGMVLVESMLCGCPVVTLSTPAKDNSQLEVVGHEAGGLVVTGLAGMVEAMRRLVRDEALRRRLGDAGRQRVLDRFGLDRVMPTLLRIAEITHGAPSRAELRRRLEAEPGVVTRVEDAAIRSLLARTLGETTLRDRVLMRLVHQPLVYRFWKILKPSA